MAFQASIKNYCDEETIASAKQLTEILVSAYNKMQRSFPYNGKGHIALSLPLLMHACVSCELDIKRWLPFHNIKIPKSFKRAAFQFKWIAKMRPVRPVGATGTETPAEMAVNSYFALLAALGALNIDMEKFADSEEIKELLYAATYREIQAANMAITFSLLEKAFPRKN